MFQKTYGYEYSKFKCKTMRPFLQSENRLLIFPEVLEVHNTPNHRSQDKNTDLYYIRLLVSNITTPCNKHISPRFTAILPIDITIYSLSYSICEQNFPRNRF